MDRREVRPGLYWVEEFTEPLEVVAVRWRSSVLNRDRQWERGDFYADAFERNGTRRRVELDQLIARVA
jgi:hypothetical protein